MDEIEIRLLDRQAEICKALGNGKRLQVIYLLRNDEERSAGELAVALETTPANASQHLQALKQAGLLSSRRDGSNIYYRLADPSVLEACMVIRKVMREQLRREQEILHSSLATDG